MFCFIGPHQNYYRLLHSPIIAYPVIDDRYFLYTLVSLIAILTSYFHRSYPIFMILGLSIINFWSLSNCLVYLSARRQSEDLTSIEKLIHFN